MNNFNFNFNGQTLFVKEVSLLETPTFSNKMDFKTLAPVTVKVLKEVDGKLRGHDLTPGNEFYNQLEKNLIKKYCKFNNLESTDKQIKISSLMRNVRSKRIGIGKDDKSTYHIGYFMDFVLEGDEELIKFAYDCGLGEKNSMGFGMIMGCFIDT